MVESHLQKLVVPEWVVVVASAARSLRDNDEFAGGVAGLHVGVARDVYCLWIGTDACPAATASRKL
jgi:hypothetical protein